MNMYSEINDHVWKHYDFLLKQMKTQKSLKSIGKGENANKVNPRRFRDE